MTLPGLQRRSRLKRQLGYLTTVLTLWVAGVGCVLLATAVNVGGESRVEIEIIDFGNLVDLSNRVCVRRRAVRTLDSGADRHCAVQLSAGADRPAAAAQCGMSQLEGSGIRRRC